MLSCEERFAHHTTCPDSEVNGVITELFFLVLAVPLNLFAMKSVWEMKLPKTFAVFLMSILICNLGSSASVAALCSEKIALCTGNVGFGYELRETSFVADFFSIFFTHVRSVSIAALGIQGLLDLGNRSTKCGGSLAAFLVMVLVLFGTDIPQLLRANVKKCGLPNGILVRYLVASEFAKSGSNLGFLLVWKWVPVCVSIACTAVVMIIFLVNHAFGRSGERQKLVSNGKSGTNKSKIVKILIALILTSYLVFWVFETGMEWSGLDGGVLANRVLGALMECVGPVEILLVGFFLQVAD